MNMAWLVVVFFLNGEPTFAKDFPPRLVVAADCKALAQHARQLFKLALPSSRGTVTCILVSALKTEPSDDTA